MTGANNPHPEDSQSKSDLGHLSAAVGHHIINAFSAVVSNAEMIRSRAALGGSASTQFETMAASIVETALDASQVARRLIDWTRRVTAVEIQAAGPEPPMVDVNRIIQAVVEAQQADMSSRIEWRLQLGQVPSIIGDQAQLLSMFDHLIRNAREAMPRGTGRVRFGTVVDGRNWLVIEVGDSGSGMPPEILKRASEPFFTTKSGHAGVGLTIAQAIWRRHRGAVSIESTPGQGTTIRLAVGPLPVADHIKPPSPSEPEQAIS
jgi:signal transduction histidine kinase